MTAHDGDQLTPAGQAPFDRVGTWNNWVSFLAQLGCVTADPATGVLVDGADSSAHVRLSADEVFDFALGSRILDEETGLPLQLTDAFFELFGSQDSDRRVTYVREGRSLRAID